MFCSRLAPPEGLQMPLGIRFLSGGRDNARYDPEGWTVFTLNSSTFNSTTTWKTLYKEGGNEPDGLISAENHQHPLPALKA